MHDFGNPEENDGRTDEKLREKSRKAGSSSSQKVNGTAVGKSEP